LDFAAVASDGAAPEQREDAIRHLTLGPLVAAGSVGRADLLS
jgi:hypothetical protein